MSFEMETLIDSMRAKIDGELWSFIDSNTEDFPLSLREMIRYPLGSHNESQKNATLGKRIRPILVLLTCHALGEDWQKATPAAVSLELLHNFTLIHDDIQDRSPIRRGQDSVWVRWGEAQAINAGDAMCALSFSACSSLRSSYPAEIVLSAIEILQRTLKILTAGQNMDIAFEKTREIDLKDYWQMIHWKTGELISACFVLGALLSGKTETERNSFRKLGLKIGCAYQVQDDWLGIWGDRKRTGKSTMSDLLERKKTYPIILAMETVPEFRNYWNTHQKFSDLDVLNLMDILNGSNVEQLTIQKFHHLYDEIFDDFSTLFLKSSQSTQLRNVIGDLLKRLN